MKTMITVASNDITSEINGMSDADRLENVRELLNDLRHSIQAQRHLIEISREMLERC